MTTELACCSDSRWIFVISNFINTIFSFPSHGYQPVHIHWEGCKAHLHNPFRYCQKSIYLPIFIKSFTQDLAEVNLMPDKQVWHCGNDLITRITGRWWWLIYGIKPFATKFSGFGGSMVEFLPVICNKIKMPLRIIEVWWFTTENENIQIRLKKIKKEAVGLRWGTSPIKGGTKLIGFSGFRKIQIWKVRQSPIRAWIRKLISRKN